MDGHRVKMGWRNLLFVLCCALLTGCGSSTLFNALEEQEANEMVAILKQYGIAAVKVVGKESCSLTVSNNDFSTAVNLLQSQGYPLPKYQTLGDVFKKSGLVSSPLEERVRFMNALADGIALTLSKIPGVLKSRVHIVLPDNDPYAEHVTPSSAAVFITYRENANVEDYVKQIKYLVTNSIEGLTAEKVSVAFFPVALPPLPKAQAYESSSINVLGIEISDSEKTPFFMLIGVLVAIIFILLVVLIWLFISTKKKKQEKTAEVENLAEASDTDISAAIEDENKEESLD